MYSPPTESYLIQERTMESVGDDIATAIETWLQEINVLEERLLKLSSLRMRIHRTISQIQYEGSHSITDMGRLQYIGDLWIAILDLLQCERTEDIKKQLLEKVLQLFDAGEISLWLSREIIMTIFQKNV